MGFDPLVANNWYAISANSIKEARRLLEYYYNGKLPRALNDLFPEIGLDLGKFKWGKTTVKQ